MARPRARCSRLDFGDVVTVDFALGVNEGIFDLELLDRMSGSYVIKIWDWVSPWVTAQRSESPTLYVELETTAEALRARRIATGIYVPSAKLYDMYYRKQALADSADGDD